MRRIHPGLLASAIALLTSCGAPTPELVFDATTPPAPVTIVPPRITASSTTSTVEVLAPPPSALASTSSPPVATSAAEPPTTVTTTTLAEAPPSAGEANTCDTSACSGPQIVAYPALTAVPQLGEDPVRGSGCGLTDEFGASMRDGLYFGSVYPSGDEVGFDVICVYFGDAALGKGADPGPASEFFPVNVGTRTRDVSLAADFVYRIGTWSADGQCVDSGPNGNADWTTVSDGTPAWLVIADGEATAAVAMCPI